MLQIICDFGTLELFGLRIPLRIYGYGLMLVLGFLTGIYLAQRRARRSGENPETVSYCGLLALMGGVIGARIAYVIENWDEFSGDGLASLGAVLNVTSGGLIYYGGFILAMGLVIGYLRMKKLSLRRYLDIVAVSLMIGLAFGRAGCTLNGCCFGDRCRADWPLAMRFPMFSKPLIKLDGERNPFSQASAGPSPVYAHQMNLKDNPVRPGPLLMDGEHLISPRYYTPEQIAVAEASWSQPVKPAQPLGIVNALLLAGILTAFYRLRSREGQVFAILLILYPITRFLLEGIRDQHHLTRGWTHNQYTSLAMVASGVIMWLILLKLPASAGATWAERQAELSRTSGEPGEYRERQDRKSRRDRRKRRR